MDRVSKPEMDDRKAAIRFVLYVLCHPILLISPEYREAMEKIQKFDIKAEDLLEQAKQDAYH